MKKQFKIAVAFSMMHDGEVVKLKAGVFETDDEKLIKSLNGSKGAKLLDSGDSKEPDSDEQLLKQLQAEYLSKTGTKPHHKAGVEKLKALIADFDKQQDK